MSRSPRRAVVSIESLARGGDGVARLDGKVCFVPMAAPGDRVAIRVVGDRRRYLRAEIEGIEAPGPDRRQPACELFGRCGGCQWLHLDEGAQVAAKAGFLRRAVGREDVDVVPSPDPLGYRRVARLHGEVSRGGSPLLGFRAAGTGGIADVRACPVLDPRIAGCLAPLAEGPVVRAGGPSIARLAAGTEGVVADLEGDGPFPRAFYEAAADLVPEVLAGITSVSGGVRTPVAGLEEIQMDGGDGAPLLTPSGSFGQANRGANLALASAVAEWVRQGRYERALELFGGSGNLTVAIAPHVGRYAVVEADGRSCRAARRNLEARGLGRVEVTNGDASESYGRLGAGVDLVVLDPPRAGDADLVRRMARGEHRAILYISCDPAILERDLGTLSRAGYAPSMAQGFDMFPQTAHVEAAVLLER